MAEINANFVVQPIELTTIVDSTDLSFTPSAINLTVSTLNKGETGATGATGPLGPIGATGPLGATGAVPGTAGANGQIQFNNLGNFAGSSNFTFNSDTSLLSINGTISVYESLENVAIIGAQTGTYNFDLLDGSIQYSTANATANIILNFRGNGSTTANAFISNAKSITSTYIMTTGNTAYTVSSITIDSSASSIKWVSGIVPTPVANSSTAYTFTIIKTSATPTYQVFGSATRYS